MKMCVIAVVLMLPSVLTLAAEPSAMPTSPNAFPEAVERAMMLDGIQWRQSAPDLEGTTIISGTTLWDDSAIQVLPGSAIQVLPVKRDRTAIEKALRKKITISVVDKPIIQFLDLLSGQAGVDINLDKKGFKEHGIKDDVTITFRTSGLPLESILTLSLRDVHLAWLIDHGVLEVTDEFSADTRDITVRTYNVADLITASRNSNGEMRDDYETLVDAITTTIDPAIWNTNGGPGNLVGATLGKSKVLVVRQSRECHQQIAKLLKAIRKQSINKSSSDTTQLKDKTK